MGVPVPRRGGHRHAPPSTATPTPTSCPGPTSPGAPLRLQLFRPENRRASTLLHNARQKGEESCACNGPLRLLPGRQSAISCLTEELLARPLADDRRTRRLAAAGRRIRQPAAAPGAGAPGRGERGLQVYLPADRPLCGDNAAMVASQGYYEFLAGNIAGSDLNAVASKKIEIE